MLKITMTIIPEENPVETNVVDSNLSKLYSRNPNSVKALQNKEGGV